jgi:hypothetical protein
VTYIPEELDEGVVYVSIQYKVATHLCMCGCGDRVVTPLNPAQWSVTYDGETVSLNHSIAGGNCNSHYFIKRGRVTWAPRLTKRQLALAAQRDLAAAQGHQAPAHDDAPLGGTAGGHFIWWDKVRRRHRKK